MAFTDNYLPDLIKAVIVCALVTGIQNVCRIGPGDSAKTARGNLWRQFLLQFTGFFGVFLLAWVWLGLATVFVPEPYLDEVFHVPQAQKYCHGKWSEWDDKITTPPGLYVSSWLMHKLWRISDCSTYSLRGMNIVATVLTAKAAFNCRTARELRFGGQTNGARRGQVGSLYAYHTGINIALFPVLFFFSGLYYTDVVSTWMVLVCYELHLNRLGQEKASVAQDIGVVVLGVLALAMRQTNIFWVVVYTGGLEAIHAIKSLHPIKSMAPEFVTVSQMFRYYAWRYSVGDIHDPSLEITESTDVILSILSIAIAILANPRRALRQIWPHVTVFSLFLVFVKWNGGVVLGDKSNHVATLHLAQMLYIWPLLLFFSAPLLVSHVISLAMELPALIEFLKLSVQGPSRSTASRPRKRQREVQSPAGRDSRHRFWALETVDKAFNKTSAAGMRGRAITVATGFIILGVMIVKHNTLIHPFTLADNRHYMFYIFRYTILRSGWMRYYLVPVYVLCGELSFFVLMRARPLPVYTEPETKRLESRADHISTPFMDSQMRQLTLQPREEQNAEFEKQDNHPTPELLGLLDDPLSTSAFQPTVSMAVLWAVATTLSLITAPLVEPRYFILPWVFWRLLIPAWPTYERRSDHQPPSESQVRRYGVIVRAAAQLVDLGRKIDLRLLLETLWFLAINAVTMGIFLLRPYYWKTEDGTLMDGGRQQRFMW